MAEEEQESGGLSSSGDASRRVRNRPLGFAITLVSALIAHLTVGDGVEAWGWAVGTGVLWCASYFFWRRVQTAQRMRR